MGASFETRFVRLNADEYFADPCSVPSLSSSIAHTIDAESPLHAHARHPRLGGVRRAPTKSLDAGSLSHALLLGAGKNIKIIEADDYRTNAAKADRDTARAAGKIPVLRDDYAAAIEVADTLRQRFVDLDDSIVLDGESELTAIWTEIATDDDGIEREVQCRGMLDHVKLPVVYDIKSIRSAHPDMCRRHVETYGYAIQHAAYVSAVERIRPDLAGRVDFVFVFYELEPPFAVTPVRLNGEFREMGRRGWRRAINKWEKAVRTNKWPAYASSALELSPSPWAMTREQDRDFDRTAQ